MELSAPELWTRVLEAARPGLPEQSFKTWLSGTRAEALTGDSLTVLAPSEFHLEWIEDRFQPVLEELLERLVGRRIELHFRIDPAGRPALPAVEFSPPTAADPAAAPRSAPSAQAPRPAEPAPDPGLNPRYTFRRFVVGTNNQLADAASRAVAENPARMYNPLFIYGGVGLGKTHLMHAIGNQIVAQDPSKTVVYVTSEQFTNELVTSIMEGTTADFRRRYRQMDLLLVDDVQFIQGKDRTQEEFFHTFNALYDAQKQIVLTSDRPPKEMSDLEERLVSRFEWGLVADIKPPDYETRIAILRRKASDDGLVLDDDVIDFIARSCSASVRELEGAVIKLLAFSSLKNQEITVDLARMALDGMIRAAGRAGGLSTPGSVTPHRIRDVVADQWNVRPDALASKRRTKDLTIPRQVAMYLIKDMLDTPLVAIGQLFGGRDHSTVIHSIRKAEEMIAADPEFALRVQNAREQVGD